MTTRAAVQLEHGIRHRTSRRWLMADGGETPVTGKARRFPDFEAADKERERIPEFANAWAAEPFVLVANGQGSVAHRTTAWAAVELAQQRVNDEAAVCPVLFAAVEQLTTARALYFATSSSAQGAVAWRAAAAAQQVLNAEATAVPRMEERVGALTAALEEYVRLGGSAERLPGVGGLS